MFSAQPQLAWIAANAHSPVSIVQSSKWLPCGYLTVYVVEPLDSFFPIIKPVCTNASSPFLAIFSSILSLQCQQYMQKPRVGRIPSRTKLSGFLTLRFPGLLDYARFSRGRE